VAGLYGPDVLARYRTGTPLDQLPPHVFSIAHASYQHGVVEEGINQSIIISGESGSGKVCIYIHVYIYGCVYSVYYVWWRRALTSPLLSAARAARARCVYRYMDTYIYIWMCMYCILCVVEEALTSPLLSAAGAAPARGVYRYMYIYISMDVYVLYSMCGGGGH